MSQQASGSNTRRKVLDILDRVAKTGIPMEIEINGKHLLISPVQKRRDLDSLDEHPDFIVGNPDNLVHMDWSDHWKPNL